MHGNGNMAFGKVWPPLRPEHSRDCSMMKMSRKYEMQKCYARVLINTLFNGCRSAAPGVRTINNLLPMWLVRHLTAVRQRCLLKGIAGKHLPFRFQNQMLVRCTTWVIVQSFDETVRPTKRDIVETGYGEGRLGIRGSDETFLCQVDLF